MRSEKIRISKLEAAARQLDCAISLWFQDGDEVSIHTLAAAAYQICHDTKEQRGDPFPLLYYSPMIKEPFRRKWINAVKSPINFFKHADKDTHAIIEFSPPSSIGLMIFAAAGLRVTGVPTSRPVHALIDYLAIHDAEYIVESYRKEFADKFPVDYINQIKLIPKAEFFDQFMSAARLL